MHISKTSPNPPRCEPPPLKGPPRTQVADSLRTWAEWCEVVGTAKCPFCNERIEAVSGVLVRHGESHKSQTACFGSGREIDLLECQFVARGF